LFYCFSREIRVRRQRQKGRQIETKKRVNKERGITEKGENK
jgi:hypothetical protein